MYKRNNLRIRIPQVDIPVRILHISRHDTNTRRRDVVVRVRQTQGLDDAVLKDIGECLAGDIFERVGEELEPDIGVCSCLPSREGWDHDLETLEEFYIMVCQLIFLWAKKEVTLSLEEEDCRRYREGNDGTYVL